MINEKLIKSSRIIDRILKILQGFCIAGIAVSAIFIPLTLALGEKIIASSDNPTFGVLKLQLADVQYLNQSYITTSIVLTLALAIITCAVFWYGIRILRSIFLPLKDGRPFEHGISDKIRKLAIVSLAGGAICEMCKVIAEIYDMKIYDLSMLFNPDVVTGYTFSYTVNLNFIILGVVLFILSHVFRYGEMLQKESDETL